MTVNFATGLRPARVDRPSNPLDAPPEYQILDFSQDWACARNLLTGQPIYRDHNQAIHDYL
jgi:hypothetical protein